MIKRKLCQSVQEVGKKILVRDQLVKVCIDGVGPSYNVSSFKLALSRENLCLGFQTRPRGFKTFHAQLN